MTAVQRVALALGLALVLPIASCTKGDHDSQTADASPHADDMGMQDENDASRNAEPGISEELQQMWPIWKPEDLELNKRSGNMVEYKHELNLRPKYYKGKMPLVYTSTQPLSGMMMGMGGPGIICVHAFDDFSNYFIYDAVLLKGIVAVDKSKTMVAEARLEWQTDPGSGFYRPTMEEFHYSGGMLVFHCRSKIDYDSGTKTSEFDQSGSKRRDYFFILPFGINAR